MTRDAIAHLDLDRDPTLRISFGEVADEEVVDKTLCPSELSRFLQAMRRKRPGSFALATTLALTGARFCHVSALKWGDLDWTQLIVRFRRKQVRGRVGPISRKKPAPKEVPMLTDLGRVLLAHGRRLGKLGYDVGSDDWVFPSRKGTLRTPASLVNAFRGALKEAGIDKRITPHKLRYCFNDVLRLAGVDSVTGRAITGHVTEEMRKHYSTVRLDEKRVAMDAVAKQLWGEKVDFEVYLDPKDKTAA
jgi:integrase